MVETLAIKCRRALQQADCGRLVLAGGVGANKRLRAALEHDAARNRSEVYFARTEFCTDNGAMIALAGALRLQAGQRQDLSIDAYPRWDLTELARPSGKP